MIVDCHAHIFAPAVRDAREAYARRDPWFGRLYGGAARLATAEDLLGSMDAAGVDKSVAMSFGWLNHADCAAGNEYVMAAAAKSDGRLIPFIAVNPREADLAVKEIERWAGAGARGVGELYAQAQGFDFGRYEDLAPVSKVCAEKGLFLCVHVTEPAGHVYPGKDSTGTANVWRFLAGAANGPKLLLPHWGGGFGFYEMMPEVAGMTGNCYYDCAASHLLYDDRVYAIMARLAPGRILFGSDFPLTSQEKMLQRVRNAGLPGPDLEGLLGLNAVSAGLA